MGRKTEAADRTVKDITNNETKGRLQRFICVGGEGSNFSQTFGQCLI